MKEHVLALSINGDAHRVLAPSNRSLLDLLRIDLNNDGWEDAAINVGRLLYLAQEPGAQLDWRDEDIAWRGGPDGFTPIAAEWGLNDLGVTRAILAVDLNDDVIDTASGKRRHQVFDGRNGVTVVIAERSAQPRIDDLVPACRDERDEY